MPGSASTPNIHLTQFEDDDKPSWLGDYNHDMQKIDADSATQTGLINSLQTQINQLSDALNNTTNGILKRLHDLDGK